MKVNIYDFLIGFCAGSAFVSVMGLVMLTVIS